MSGDRGPYYRRAVSTLSRILCIILLLVIVVPVSLSSDTEELDPRSLVCVNFTTHRPMFGNVAVTPILRDSVPSTVRLSYCAITESESTASDVTPRLDTANPRSLGDPYFGSIDSRQASTILPRRVLIPLRLSRLASRGRGRGMRSAVFTVSNPPTASDVSARLHGSLPL